MKRFILLGVIFVCSVLAAIVMVEFRSSARDALGRWFELSTSLIGILLVSSFMWLLFLAAQLGRKGSRELPNHDRTAGYRFGLRVILSVAAGLMSWLSIYVVFFDQPGNVTGSQSALHLGGVMLPFSLGALLVWRSRQMWNAQRIAWRGLLGRGEAPWSDLERIEHGFQDGQVTFHFAGKKKLSILGGFHEAADELVHLAQEILKQVVQAQSVGSVQSTGTAIIGIPMRVLMTLLLHFMIGLMGYLFWQNTISVSGDITVVNAAWALGSAGAGLYSLYLAWLFQGPRYLWNAQALTYFDGTWREKHSTSWSNLQAVDRDQMDTDTRVLIFKGDLELKVFRSLKGAKDLIEYAESRLNA